METQTVTEEARYPSTVGSTSQVDEWSPNDHSTAQELALRMVEALRNISDSNDAGVVLAQIMRKTAESDLFQRIFKDEPRFGTAARFLPSAPNSHTPLSVRENTVLQLICGGLSNKCIARELQIAPETVKSHAKHIFIKLKAPTRAAAVARAARFNLIKSD